ncbi:MAG TPA: heavy metal-associated domain-containing protein [Candidatus Saccharimonadales bacterium]|nr:heavy metal-associated domain-containing protein [Candidatus Saccharimonadales bacterium]
MTQNIKISGLTCAACQKLITKRLKTIEGIQDVAVAITGETEITAQQIIDKTKIAGVLVGTQYAVE